MMPNCFYFDYSVRTSCRCSIMIQVFRYSTADWKVDIELTTFIGSETGSRIPFKHDLPLLDMNIDDLIFSRYKKAAGQRSSSNRARGNKDVCNCILYERVWTNLVNKTFVVFYGGHPHHRIRSRAK